MDTHPPALPDTPAPPPLPAAARATPLGDPRARLKLLAVFYWISATFMAFGLVFLILLLAVGYQKESQTDFSDPGGIAAFVIVGVLLVLLLPQIVLAVLTALNLPRARRRLLCQITGGAACLWGLPGIGLGIWTLVSLQRPDIRALFDAPPDSTP